MEDLPLHSAKGDEIVSAFMRSAPFHNGRPCVLGVRSIENPKLQWQHEAYRRYLTEKNGAAPRQVELYHGTNVKILDGVYRHGWGGDFRCLWGMHVLSESCVCHVLG